MEEFVDGLERQLSWGSALPCEDEALSLILRTHKYQQSRVANIYSSSPGEVNRGGVTDQPACVPSLRFQAGRGPCLNKKGIQLLRYDK